MINITQNTTDISVLDNWTDETRNSTTKDKTLEQWNHEFFIIQIPVLTILSAFLVTGILGNGSVIYVYFVRFRRYSEKRFYIPVLAVTDLSACVVNSGVLLTEVFFWVSFPSEILCKTINYLAMLTTTVLVSILLLIAIDRYEAISKPLKIPNGVKRKRVFVILIIFTSMVASTPVLFYFGVAVISSEDGKLSGYRCKIVADHGLELVYAFHFLWLSIGVGILITLSVLYALIYRHVKKPKLYSEQHRNESASSGHHGADHNLPNGEIAVITVTVPTNHPDGPTACPKSLQRTCGKTSNTKLTILFAVITFVFAICFIPKLVVMILSAVKEDFWETIPNHQLVFYKLLHSVYIFHSVANPAIYSLCDTKFQKELKAICRCAK